MSRGVERARRLARGRLRRALAKRRNDHAAHARDVSALVHDLNNPLTVVQGNLHFLRDALPNAGDAREALNDIENATARLGRMLDDARLLARLERGDPPAARHPCSAAVIARAAVAEEILEAQNREIVVAIEARDAEILGDDRLLRRALAALLVTVVQHSPSRGIVRVTVEPRLDEVRFLVDGTAALALAAEELDALVRGVVRPGATARSAFRMKLARIIFGAHGGSVAAEETRTGTMRLSGIVPME